MLIPTGLIDATGLYLPCKTEILMRKKKDK